tara:strand:- start:111 stop:353 length:243 start_codon:yes stop_codon:yes gene_type:complete
MNYGFIRKNINSFAIIIFLVLFILLNYFQPGFIYNNDGSLREFGLGQRRKTILPIWLLSIILGILSYLGVLYYISIPKFR